jgi:hypothetical protein
MAIFTKISDVSEFQLVSSVEAFKGEQPHVKRKFAEIPDDMRFCTGASDANSDLNICLDGFSGALHTEYSRKMSFHYTKSSNVDFAIDNGIFIEKFMFSQTGNNNDEEDFECHDGPNCTEDSCECDHPNLDILDNVLSVYLKYPKQFIPVTTLLHKCNSKSYVNDVISFVLPTGDVLQVFVDKQSTTALN